MDGRAFVYIGPPTLLPLQPLAPPAGHLFLPTASGGLHPEFNSSLFWAAEPWVDAPTKVSVNTGTFGQLYTAFWSAMADYSNRDNTAYLLRPDGLTYPPGPPAGTQFKQFYNPLRDPTQNAGGTASAPLA